jgi:peptidoglycan hydrolase CwlO-like protein
LSRTRLPRAVRAAAVITVALVLGALVGVPAGADTKGQLATAKAQLNRLIDRISAAGDAVGAIQSQANEIARANDAVQSKIAKVQGQIVEIQADITKAGKQLDATQEQLDQRAWVAYETGPAFTLEILLSADSLSDLSDRLAIVNAATQSDRSLIEKIQGLEARLRTRQAKLTNLQTGLRADQADLVEKETALQ